MLQDLSLAQLVQRRSAALEREPVPPCPPSPPMPASPLRTGEPQRQPHQTISAPPDAPCLTIEGM